MLKKMTDSEYIYTRACRIRDIIVAVLSGTSCAGFDFFGSIANKNAHADSDIDIYIKHFDNQYEVAGNIKRLENAGIAFIDKRGVHIYQFKYTNRFDEVNIDIATFPFAYELR